MLEKVLLRQSTEVALEEVTHVSHVAVQVEHAFGDTVGITHVVGPREGDLNVEVASAGNRPPALAPHLFLQVAPTGVETGLRLSCRGGNESERRDRDLNVRAGMAGSGRGASVQIRERGRTVRACRR